jgi:hypothetical protein
VAAAGKPQAGLPVGHQQELPVVLVEDHEVADQVDVRDIGLLHPIQRSSAGDPLRCRGEMYALLLVPGADSLQQIRQPGTKKLVRAV